MVRGVLDVFAFIDLQLPWYLFLLHSDMPIYSTLKIGANHSLLTASVTAITSAIDLKNNAKMLEG